MKKQVSIALLVLSIAYICGLNTSNAQSRADEHEYEHTQTYTGTDIVENWIVCDELPPLGANETELAAFLCEHTIQDAWKNGSPVLENLTQTNYAPILWLISNNEFKDIVRVSYTLRTNCWEGSIFDGIYINNEGLSFLDWDINPGQWSTLQTDEIMISITPSAASTGYPDGRIALPIPNPASEFPVIEPIYNSEEAPITEFQAINITTYVPAPLIDRDLHWSETEITAYLDEEFTAPKLLGKYEITPYFDSDRITYSSSNTDIVTIDATSGAITLISEGTSIITAKCEARGNYAAGEASFTLNVVIRPVISGTGTDETIIMDEAGTLESRISDLETLRVRSLVIKGPFNGSDLAYLHKQIGQGRFSNLQGIDLSEAKLTPDDVEYAKQVTQSDVSFGTTTTHFIMSTENKVETTVRSTALGGDIIDHYVYNNYLAGAFYGMENLRLGKLPSNITKIGNYTFGGCHNLVETEIPSGVEEIGNYAFSECKLLTKIAIPETVSIIGKYAFASSGLKDVSLRNVQEIGNFAFQKCSNLRSNIDLSKLTVIGEGTFYQSPISSVILSNKLQSIGKNAFNATSLSAITIPESCVSIGEMSFANSLLETISLPETVTDIWSNSFANTPWENTERNKKEDIIYINDIALIVRGAFSESPLKKWKFREGTRVIANVSRNRYDFNTSVLTQAELPSSLRIIGDNVFDGAELLTEIKLPDNLEHIGNYAFSCCTDLTEINLGSKLKYIGSYAFNSCFGLAEIAIGSSVREIGNYAFFNCLGLIRVRYDSAEATGNYIFRECSSIENVYFGEHVRIIPDNFCSELPIKSLNFSEGLREIGKSAFSNTQISRIEIPNSVTKIGNRAFENCSNLIEANIPLYIKDISDIYLGCINLKKVYYDAINADISSNPRNVFGGCNNLSTIIFGEQVEEINGNMPPSLENVTFLNPSSLKYIEDGFYKTKFRNNLPGNEVNYIGTCALCYDITHYNGKEINIEIKAGTKSVCGNFLKFRGSYTKSDIINVKLPETIERIGYSAFEYGIDNINLPSSLKRLDNRCFYGWLKESVVLPSGIKWIGYQILWSDVLKQVNIPRDVEYINPYAFEICSNLSDIYCYSTEPDIVAYAIINADYWCNTNFTLHVMPESYSDYMSCEALDGIHIVADLKNMDNIEMTTVEAEGISIVNGGIEICNNTADIYNLNGVKLKESVIGRISLSPGTYIIRYDNNTIKLLIR